MRALRDANIVRGTRLSKRLTALLSALVAWKFGLTWQMALALVFTWTLIALTFIDADTTLAAR